MKKVFMSSVTATLALLACVFLAACGRETASEGLEYVVNVEETTHPVTGVDVVPDTGTTVPEKYKKKTCTVIGLGSCTDTEIVIPKVIDGYTVTGIDCDILAEHPGVTSVKLPSSVSSIEPGAFRNCPTLTSVGVSRGNTFYHIKGNCLIETATGRLICGVGDVAIPSDGSIKYIADWAFAGNEGLAELAIPEGVTSIGSCAFKDCTALRNITLPESLVEINYETFAGCTALRSIVIPSGVAWLNGGEFKGCIALESVCFEGDLARIGQSSFGNCESLTDIGFGGNSLYIESESFLGCTSLRSITLPAGTSYIGERAFSGCSSLTDIRYDGTMLEWEAVEKDKKWSRGLEAPTIHCSNGDVGDKVIFADSGFTYRINADNQSCTIISFEPNGSEPVIPDATASGLRVTNIAAEAFRNMTDIVGITLPSGLTSIDNGLFEGFTRLKSIALPSGVTEIGRNAFRDCVALENIALPSGVTKIGGGAFGGCTSLRSIALPSGVTKIGGGAFSGCTSLESVTLPDGITEIEANTFDSCTALASADIPASVNNIRSSAFGDCPALTDVNYAGTTSQWRRVVRRYDWCKSSPVSVHCTDGDGNILEEDE